ncbi:galactokinase [Gordonia neofelifaecis]|uniref:Galactokinase n=1 Tax=Gordonia neofelifaecis NRRL B-59395 TaxID=644548 RepID=F1YKZ5_9ACTN|nr:galactokinase [Gordonia neofelifaecis]EGD54600.1 galactokinase [Gordonia neofelifaecis NRRL B-59395]
MAEAPPDRSAPGTATIRAYAPGRVNLIGEHTDYNEGFALPIALQLGTTVSFVPDPATDSITASSDLESHSVRIPLNTAPGGVTGWGAYVAGCVWALRERGTDVPGGRMSISSDLPVGAGLSSSAALECAVLRALTAAAATNPDRRTLALLAQRAENDYVGAPTGLLDQLSSLFGEVDTALLLDFRSLQVTPVPVDLGTTSLLVIDSRAPHRNVAGEYRSRRLACEEAARHLSAHSLRYIHDDGWRELRDDVLRRRARHVLTENRRVHDAAAALRAGDLPGLGRLMDASHASMRDDFEITTEGIDLIAETARKSGAFGARMTGGGFGGSVVVLAPAEAAQRIRTALPDRVEQSGLPRPTVTPVRPGGGAGLQMAR